MSPRNSLIIFDLLEKIQSEYDEKSILKGLELIEAGNELEGMIVDAIVQGRRGMQYWERIEAAVKEKPDLKSIGKTMSRLPRKDIDHLIEKAESSEDELIAEILNGGTADIHVLPENKKREIFCRLRQLVFEMGNCSQSANVLSYLLLFDAPIKRGANLLTGETHRLAIDWCSQFESSDLIDPVLAELLRVSRELPKDSSERCHLIDMGYRRLLICSDEREKRFLLAGLMEADGSKRGRRKIAKWLNKNCRSADRAHELDSLIIHTWLHVTRCNRDSFARGKRFIEKPMILDEIASYSERKFVRRGLLRYLRRNLKHGRIQKVLSTMLLRVRERSLLRLAKNAIDLADDKLKFELVRQVAPQDSDPKIVAMVKDKVLRHPDAPDSYLLVCAIAKADPAFAAPWIAEWLKTAMPEQKSTGYALLLRIAPTLANAQSAYEWLREVYERDLPITQFEQMVLVTRLLPLRRDDLLEERATKLLSVRSGTIRECEFRKLEAALSGFPESDRMHHD